MPGATGYPKSDNAQLHESPGQRLHFEHGSKSDARIGWVDGLAVAAVGPNIRLDAVVSDLSGIQKRHDIPSGVLLFVGVDSDVLSDERLDALANQSISVEDASSSDVDAEIQLILDDFLRRQAFTMKRFTLTS